MKNKKHTMIASRAVALLILLSVTACSLFLSCSKSSNNNTTTTNYAAPYLGTWTSTSSTCGTAGGTSTFSAGTNGNDFTLPATIGTSSSSCTKTITVNCVAASNNTFTIPSATYTDNCGLSYTISGGGSISGSTMTFNTIFSGAISANCTATLTKGTITNYATQYLGTWNNATSTCGATSGTTTFSAGSTNDFTFSGTIGSGACTKSVTLTCVAASNNTFTIPSTTYTDNCSASYTFSGSGSISGNTITMNLICTGATNINCTGTYTK